MDLPKDVINRPTIPTNPEEKFVYHSEWLVAIALTQTYGYMVDKGLEYSYLTTGEAKVFLQVREAEPHTLYYHLAEPNIEAEAQDVMRLWMFDRSGLYNSEKFNIHKEPERFIRVTAGYALIRCYIVRYIDYVL
jgi:Fungal protein kinase